MVNSSSRRTNTKILNAVSTVIESLEQRVLLAADAVLSESDPTNYPGVFNLLTITGTSAPDDLEVLISGDQLKIGLNGSVKVFNDPSNIITQINLNALGGADIVVVNTGVARNITINPGSENDKLYIYGTTSADNPNQDAVSKTTFPLSDNKQATITTPFGEMYYDGRGGKDNLNVTGSGTHVILNSSQTFDTLGIGAGAKVTMSTVTHQVMLVHQLNIEENGSQVPLGTLEMHNNDLILDYTGSGSDYAKMVRWAKSGMILLGGTGVGLASSEVDDQTPAGTMIAIIDDGDPNIGGGITNLSGQDIPNPTSSLLNKYTWFGDSNFDGVVDTSDYALIDTGFTSSGTLVAWVFGDYNYSGTVDGEDYALIDTGFINQSSQLGGTVVRNFKAEQYSPTQVNLSWDKPSGITFTGYTLWASIDGGQYNPINTILGPDATSYRYFGTTDATVSWRISLNTAANNNGPQDAKLANDAISGLNAELDMVASPATAIFDQDSRPQNLVITFNTLLDVSNRPSADQIVIDNLTTDTQLLLQNSDLSYQDVGGKTKLTVSFAGRSNSTLPGITDILPTGWYRVSINGQDIHPSGGGTVNDFDYDFHFIPGDFNSDGIVDSKDQQIAATDQTTATYSQGDLNFSGQVNVADRTLLNSLLGYTVHSPFDQLGAVRLTPTGMHSVLIEWNDSVEGESSWRVQMSTDGVNFASQSVASDSNHFTWEGLHAGRRYWFRVKAITSDPNVSYQYTKTRSTMTWLPGPASLSIDELGRSSLNLHWIDNSQGEAGFKIYQSTNGGAFAQIATVPASTSNENSVSYPVTGLAPSTNYTYFVTAYNAFSESVSSAVITVQTSTPSGNVFGIQGPSSGNIGQAAKFSVIGDDSPSSYVYTWSVYSGNNVVQTGRGKTFQFLPQTGGSHNIKLIAVSPGISPKIISHTFSVSNVVQKTIKISGNPLIEVGNLSIFSISPKEMLDLLGPGIEMYTWPENPDDPIIPNIYIDWTVTPANTLLPLFTKSTAYGTGAPIDLMYAPPALGEYSISVSIRYKGELRVQSSILANATNAESDNTIRNMIGNDFFGVAATDIVETNDGHILVAGPSRYRLLSYPEGQTERGDPNATPPIEPGSGFTLIRLDEKLELDTTFGVDGYIEVHDERLTTKGIYGGPRLDDFNIPEGNTGAYYTARDNYATWQVKIAETYDHNIVLATSVNNWDLENPNTGWIVYKYNQQGSLDTQFGLGGSKTLYLPQFDDVTDTGGYENSKTSLLHVGDIAIQKDIDEDGFLTERIVLAGDAVRSVLDSQDSWVGLNGAIVGAVTRLDINGNQENGIESPEIFGDENGWMIFGNEMQIEIDPVYHIPAVLNLGVGLIHSIEFQSIANLPQHTVTGIVLAGESTHYAAYWSNPGGTAPEEGQEFYNAAQFAKTGIVVARLNADGTLDTNTDSTPSRSFGPDGKGFVTTTPGHDEIPMGNDHGGSDFYYPSAYARSIDIDASGNIVAFGTTGWYQANFGNFTENGTAEDRSYAIVSKYSANGIPDTTFGDLQDDAQPSLGKLGHTIISFYGGELIADGHLTSEGKMILVGDSINGGMIARLNNDGTPDETFGPYGRQTVDRNYTVTDPDYRDGWEWAYDHESLSAYQIHDMWHSAFITQDGDILATGSSGRVDPKNGVVGYYYIGNDGGHRISVVRYQPKDLNIGDLTASADENGNVRLHWEDRSKHEDGFIIRRAETLAGLEDASSEIAFVASNLTDYIDSTIEQDTRYFYRVYTFASVGGYPYLGAKTNDVEIITPLDAGGYILQDIILLPIRSPDEVESNIELESGSTYLISVNGEFYVYDNPVGTGFGDSEYGWYANGVRKDISYYIEGHPVNYGVAINDSSVDELKMPYWGSPATDSSRSYSISYVPTTTGKLRFSFHDSVYGDNSTGTPVTIRIFRALPAAPTGLIAEPDREHKRIKLTWKNSISNANRVVVQRATGDDGYVNIASLPGSDESFIDSSIDLNTQYSYRVKIENGFGLSKPSGQAYAVVVNESPEIDNYLEQFAKVGTEFKYQLQAVDPDGDNSKITYEILGTKPATMQIEPDGSINGWVPGNQLVNGYDNPGSRFSIRFKATDEDGGSEEGILTIGVLPDPNSLPIITQAASAELNPNDSTRVNLNVSAELPPLNPKTTIYYKWETIAKPLNAGRPTFDEVNRTETSNTMSVRLYSAGIYRFKVSAIRMYRLKDRYGNESPDSELIADPWPAVSEVQINIDQIYSGVAISPAAVTLVSGKTQKFTASAIDQFGAPVPGEHSFNWSIISSQPEGPQGIINSSGEYTAPEVGEAIIDEVLKSEVVQAVDISDVTKFGTSNVNVVGSTVNTDEIEDDLNSFRVRVLSFSEISLSIRGINPTGPENEVIYSWEVIEPDGMEAGWPSWPVDLITPKFKINNSNDARDTVLICDDRYPLNYELKIKMRNKQGVKGEVTYRLSGDNRNLSSIELSPLNAVVEREKQIAYHAVALDQYGRKLNPQPVFEWKKNGYIETSISGSDYTFTAPSSDGEHTIEVISKVTTNNITIEKSRKALVKVIGEEPAVLRISGFDGTKDQPTEINSDIAVNIIADDPNDGDPISWVLWVRDSEGNRSKIASGNTPIGNAPETPGIATILHPASLKNGDYTLELTALETDTSPVDVKYFRVQTEFKLGSLNLPFTDAQIDIPGADPLTAIRVYDSMNKDEQGDFGYGWKLQANDSDSRSTEYKGEGHFIDGNVPALRTQDIIYLKTPDGQEHAFMFVPTPISNTPGGVLTGITNYKPQFVAVDGSVAKLSVDPNVLIGNTTFTITLRQDIATGEWFYSTGTGTSGKADGYNPKKSRFGNWLEMLNDDGTKYTFDGSGKLLSSTDPNGHITNYNTNNPSTDSRSFVIRRDAGNNNRITDISDAPGFVEADFGDSTKQNLFTHYTYDTIDGDLISVRDRTLQITQFVYEKDASGKSTHRLIKIIDPRNVEILAAEYNPSTGQLDKLTDSAGKSSTVTSDDFDGTDLAQTSTDTTGAKTETKYNDRGDVIREIKEIRNNLGVITGYQVTVREYSYGEWNDSAFRLAQNTGVTFYNKLLSFKEYIPFTVDVKNANNRYTQNGTVVAHETIYQGIDPNDPHPEDPGLFQVESDSVLSPNLGPNDTNQYLTTSYLKYFAPGKPSIIKDPYGNLTWNIYNDMHGGKNHGNLTQTIDSHGNGTETVYDDDGRVIATYKIQITNPSWVPSETDLPPFDPNNDRVLQLSATDYYPADDAANGEIKGKLKSTTNSDGVSTHYVYWTSGTAYGQVKSVSRTWPGHATPVVDSTTYYDDSGRVKQATDANGKSTYTHYDKLGQSVVTIDQFGGKTIQTYDRRGLLIRTLYPDSTETRTAYDDLGRAEWTSERFASSSIATVASVDANNIATITYSSNDNTATYVVTRNLYDSLGRVIGTERYKNAKITISDDTPTGATVTILKTVAPDAAAMQIAGNRLSISSTAYDGAGRVKETKDASNLITQTEYYDNGQVYRTRQIPPVGSPTPWTTYQFDQPISSYSGTVPSADRYDVVTDAKGHKTYTFKDQTGKVIRTTYGVGTSDESFVESMSGIGSELAVPIENINKLPTDSGYIDIDTPSEIASGIPLGYRHEISIEQRKAADIPVVTHRLYDAGGRLTDVWLPAVDDALTPANDLVRPHWHYTYDKNGNQLTQVDPRGNTTTFGYNNQGQRTSRQLPLGQTETWHYDSYGRVDYHVSFEGIVTGYTYDNSAAHAGRLQTKSFYANLAEYNNGAGTPVRTVTYNYDSLGRIYTIVDSRNGTWTYGYDFLGNQNLVQQPNGKSIRHEYDPATGRLTRTYTGSLDDSRSSISGDGKAITDTRYGYDSFGRLQTVQIVERQDTKLTTPETCTYGYDAIGNLDWIKQSNGVTSDYEYDSLNRLHTLTHFVDADNDHVYRSGETIKDRFEYTLSNNGQRTQAVETDDQNRVTNFYWTYDAINRLTSEVYDGPGTSSDYIEVFDFDLNSNRRKLSKVNAATPPQISGFLSGVEVNYDEITTYSYDNNDRLNTESKDSTTDSNDRYITYSYGPSDAYTYQTSKVVYAGLNTSGSIMEQQNYQYDEDVRMTQSTVAIGGTTTVTTNVYDDSGIRIKSTVATTPSGGSTTTVTHDYTIDAANPTGYAQILEEFVNGVIKNTFTIGLDVLTQYDSTNRAMTLIYDGHGSTRQLLNNIGNIIQRYVYEAFGNMITNGDAGLSDLDSVITSLLYSGEITDAFSRMQYVRNRWYTPSSGVFSSRDRLDTGTADPQYLHKYLYGNGNPIAFVDPSGNVSFSVGDLLSAIGVDTNIRGIKDVSAARVRSEASRELRDNLQDVIDWRESGENAVLAGIGARLWEQRLTSLGYYTLNLQRVPVGQIGPDMLAIGWIKGRLRLLVGEVKAMTRSRTLSALDRLNDGTVQMAAGWISGHISRFLAPAVGSVISAAAGQFPAGMDKLIEKSLNDYRFDVYLLRARKYKGKGWKLRGIELMQIGRQEVRASEGDAIHQSLVGDYPNDGQYLNDLGL